MEIKTILMQPVYCVNVGNEAQRGDLDKTHFGNNDEIRIGYSE